MAHIVIFDSASRTLDRRWQPLTHGFAALNDLGLRPSMTAP